MHGSTPNIICVGTMSADVPPPPVGSIGLWGAGEGELKTQKIGVVSFVHRTATISIFLSDAKCGPVCRAQTCAHSLVEPLGSANSFLHGGPKTSKKFRIFHHFETLIHISQKLLKIEAYKQRGEKALSLPYPTVACVWTHRSRGSAGWAKNE